MVSGLLSCVKAVSKQKKIKGHLSLADSERNFTFEFNNELADVYEDF